MVNITKFALIASLARKAVKDTVTFESLLYDAGVFLEENDKLVGSLVKQRELSLERLLKSPAESFDGHESAAQLKDQFVRKGWKPVKLKPVSVEDDELAFDGNGHEVTLKSERECGQGYSCDQHTMSGLVNGNGQYDCTLKPHLNGKLD
jgi:hypothetical protein